MLKILRMKQLEEMLGVSKGTIYRWRDEGNFPQSVQLGARAVGWREDDVREWLDKKNLSE